MVLIKNDILPAAVYNTLPHIDSVENVSKDHAGDIAELTALLAKHKVDDRVSIKLIHIHFELKEGEVFAARDISVPGFGDTNIMQAVPARRDQPLYGYHYYVNGDGNLAAYEYMSQPGLDLSRHPEFVREFCELVRKRRLQKKLGLAVRHTEQTRAISELEYPSKRACLNVPAEVPLPHSQHSIDTTTEFVSTAAGGKGGNCGRYCRYTKRRYQASEWSDSSSTVDNDSSDSHSDSSSGDSEIGSGHDNFDIGMGDHDFDPGLGLFVVDGPPRQISLGGRKLHKGTGLYKIVSFISDRL